MIKERLKNDSNSEILALKEQRVLLNQFGYDE